MQIFPFSSSLLLTYETGCSGFYTQEIKKKRKKKSFLPFKKKKERKKEAPNPNQTVNTTNMGSKEGEGEGRGGARLTFTGFADVFCRSWDVTMVLDSPLYCLCPKTTLGVLTAGRTRNLSGTRKLRLCGCEERHQ